MMPFHSLTPSKLTYRVEVNGKVLDSEFDNLVDATKTASAYEAEGFKAMIFDSVTGRLVGTFGN